MSSDLNSRDFAGTNIKSPLEKMRAMSIITAKDDPTGLSMINFNLSNFLKKHNEEDIFFIFGQWATEPVKRSPGKFIRFPASGKEALITRTDALMRNLSQRQDINDNFIESASKYMYKAIDKEVMYLGTNDRFSTMEKSA